MTHNPTKHENKLYYCEKCDNYTMHFYPFIIDKLVSIQKLCVRDRKKLSANVSRLVNKSYPKSKHIYKLSSVLWDDSIMNNILNKKSYPSEYFINLLLNIIIFNGKILNPPIYLNPDQIKKFTYVKMEYNSLIIIDGLFNQGSMPRYYLEVDDRFIYSEHSGVISINNNTIDNIIVSTETKRIGVNDPNIYLPINSDTFKKYPYIFHTHPNTKTYAGRIDQGIFYELPSVSDILNFVKYYNYGNLQASIIFTPEGTYVLRPIKYIDALEIDEHSISRVQKCIANIEHIAITKYSKLFTQDVKNEWPDIFHNTISSDLEFVDRLNQILKHNLIYVEFYPRIKVNNEWMFRKLNLPYMSRK